MKSWAETRAQLRMCKVCKHQYLEPCDGKNARCGNLAFASKPTKTGKKARGDGR